MRAPWSGLISKTLQRTGGAVGAAVGLAYDALT